MTVVNIQTVTRRPNGRAGKHFHSPACIWWRSALKNRQKPRLYLFRWLQASNVTSGCHIRGTRFSCHLSFQPEGEHLFLPGPCVPCFARRKHMTTFIDHQKAFISLFNRTARYHKRHKVFEDFISCSVIALENRLQFSEAREQKYLRIVSGYEKSRMLSTLRICLPMSLRDWSRDSATFWAVCSVQLELGTHTGASFSRPGVWPA